MKSHVLLENIRFYFNVRYVSQVRSDFLVAHFVHDMQINPDGNFVAEQTPNAFLEKIGLQLEAAN